MMRGFILIFLGIFLTIGFSFFIFNLALGQNDLEPVCPDPPPDPSWSSVSSWDEYKCENNGCKGNRLIRVISQVYGETCSLATTPKEPCPSYSWSCSSFEDPPVPGSAQVLDTAPAYAACQGGEDWSTTLPSFGCKGSCLEAPQNPRYYNNPTYSDQPDKDISNTNIKLPVKLDWDDILGWQMEYGPQSYAMRITTSTDIFSDILDKSEYIPRACLLPSNKTSNWSVKACCGIDGTDCGPTSNWNFTTNLAPEPVSPYDPDWTGEKGAENIAIPITLDWCDVTEAQSYRLNVYIITGGEKKCHPWLLKVKEGETICEPWLLEKTARERYQTEEVLYSDFPDPKMDFFTKSTEYQWEIKTCLDKYGLECQDYSQLWSFTTASTTLPLASQFYPADDPTGKNPVGLPLVLQWDDKPGMNSYYYEVTSVRDGSTITGKNTSSQSLPFNYPQLALNTPYKWRVKSCWDYKAKNCEAEFSQEWNFTTTGRPPQLIYPASGADKIPIPLTLDWEDVPGAGSYVFKIQGDGLSLEKVLNESEFPMDFPAFNIRQEKNYSWQVKTCAWQEAKGACGLYANLQNFRTFRMPPPAEPSPINEGLLSTDDKSVTWGVVAGAKAYQYQIKYLSLLEKEKDETCPALVGKELSETPKTTAINSAFVELKCLGDYQWQVRACLDQNCEEVGTWSGLWSFSLVEPGDIIKAGGLVPCGRNTNNPKTPWNEREPCQIKHIFLFIKVLIDFLLFRIAPLALVLLTVTTGVMLYFPISTGSAAPLARIKSLWKSAGIGLAIIFFAWTIVNIILKLAGFQVGIFGNWYQIPL